MSIIIRGLIIVACAYAGSAVASGQFGAMPSRQLTTVIPLNRAGLRQPSSKVCGGGRQTCLQTAWLSDASRAAYLRLIDRDILLTDGR